MHQSAPRRRSAGGRRRSGDLINWGNNNNHRDTRWHSPSSSPESEPSCGREDCCEQPRLMGNNNWPGDIPSQHCPPSIWLLTPLTATHKHGGRITLLHFIITRIFSSFQNQDQKIQMSWDEYCEYMWLHWQLTSCDICTFHVASVCEDFRASFWRASDAWARWMNQTESVRAESCSSQQTPACQGGRGNCVWQPDN